MNLIVNGKHSFIANVLIVGIERIFYIVDSEFFNSFEHFGIGVGRFESELFFADFSYDRINEVNDFLVFFMTLHNSVVHNVVGNFVSACFNHSNKVGSRGNG